MKIIYILLGVLFIFFNDLLSQNIDWEARVYNVRSVEGSTFSTSSCWETGDEEYTSLFSVKDNIMSSFSARACVQCNNNGNCSYGGNTFIASNSNVNATNLQLWFQGWEDDGGDRCTYDSGDDCECSNTNLANITIRSGTLCGWHTYGDYSCGSHDQIRIGVRWRWTKAVFSAHPSNQTACAGSTATFSAALQSTTNGGATYQWQYFDGSNWVNQGSASTTYSNLTITASTPLNGRQYRLVVSQCDYDGGTRYTYSNAATLTVNTLSNSASSITGVTSKCNGGTSTFSVSGGTLGTGAEWKWYTGSCGGTLVGTGSSLNYILPVGTTNLFVRAEGTCNTTACVSKTITVNQSSSAATGANISHSAICSGNTVDVTATGGSLGTNATWRWYSNSSLSTQIATGNPVSINPVTYPIVYVAAVDTSGICPTTVAYTVNLSGVNVHTPSIAPTSTNYSSTPANVCINESVNVQVIGGSLGNGAVWRLYDRNPTLPGAVLITSSSSNNFSFVPTATQSYWVRAENLCGNTTAVEVKVIVNSSSVNTGTLTNVNSTFTCVVNDNNWHYFRNSNNDIIAAINSQGQNLGNVTISTTLGNSGPFGNGGERCSGVGEYHLSRVVRIVSTYAHLNPVLVKLFFTESEYLAHKSISDAQSNFYKYCYGTTSSPSDLTVSAINSLGLPDSIEVLSKNLKSGHTDIYEFDVLVYNMPANGTYTGGRINTSGLDLYIHNSSGLYSVLPVELTYFKGSYYDLSNHLEWATASELNNDHFVIERSEDGVQFVVIGQVNGAGTTSEENVYHYADRDIQMAKTYYYRLKQVDYDGFEEYSSVIQISTPNPQQIEVSVYPNPTTDQVYVRVLADKNYQNLKLNLYHTNGQLIQEGTYQLVEGINQLNLSLKGLPAGTYLLSINSDSFEEKVSIVKVD